MFYVSEMKTLEALENTKTACDEKGGAPNMQNNSPGSRVFCVNWCVLHRGFIPCGMVRCLKCYTLDKKVVFIKWLGYSVENATHGYNEGKLKAAWRSHH